MPGEPPKDPIAACPAADREAVFAAAWAAARADGALGASERNLLHDLERRLGIDPEAARRVETMSADGPLRLDLPADPAVRASLAACVFDVIQADLATYPGETLLGRRILHRLGGFPGAPGAADGGGTKWVNSGSALRTLLPPTATYALSLAGILLVPGAPPDSPMPLAERVATAAALTALYPVPPLMLCFLIRHANPRIDLRPVQAWALGCWLLPPILVLSANGGFLVPVAAAAHVALAGTGRRLEAFLNYGLSSVGVGMALWFAGGRELLAEPGWIVLLFGIQVLLLTGMEAFGRFLIRPPSAVR